MKSSICPHLCDMLSLNVSRVFIYERNLHPLSSTILQSFWGAEETGLTPQGQVWETVGSQRGQAGDTDLGLEEPSECSPLLVRQREEVGFPTFFPGDHLVFVGQKFPKKQLGQRARYKPLKMVM